MYVSTLCAGPCAPVTESARDILKLASTIAWR